MFALNTDKLTFSPLIRHVRVSRAIPRLPTHLYSDGCLPLHFLKVKETQGQHWTHSPLFDFSFNL